MSSSTIIQLDDANFASAISKYSRLLVDFWAPWCGPCRMLSPIIDEISQEYSSQGLVVAKVNVDDSPRVSAENRITSIPTLMFFKDGVLTERTAGSSSKGTLIEKVVLLLSVDK
jgi:thioredoxin 1